MGSALLVCPQSDTSGSQANKPNRESSIASE